MRIEHRSSGLQKENRFHRGGNPVQQTGVQLYELVIVGPFGGLVRNQVKRARNSPGGDLANDALVQHGFVGAGLRESYRFHAIARFQVDRTVAGDHRAAGLVDDPRGSGAMGESNHPGDENAMSGTARFGELEERGNRPRFERAGRFDAADEAAVRNQQRDADELAGIVKPGDAHAPNQHLRIDDVAQGLRRSDDVGGQDMPAHGYV